LEKGQRIVGKASNFCARRLTSGDMVATTGIPNLLH